MPEVALFGEWTTANLGDRAILAGVQRFAANAGWTTRSFALGSLLRVDDDIAFRSLGAGRAPHFSQSILREAGQQRIKSSLRGVRQHYRGRKMVPHLEGCQAILLGGGALLTDSNLHFPQSLSAVTKAAWQLSIPLLSLGCSSASSLSAQGQRLLTEFLDACIFIGTRDRESQAQVESLLRGRDIHLFGDFALDPFQKPNPAAPGDRRASLAVNVMLLSAPFSRHQGRYESVLIEIAVAWMEKHDDGLVEVFTTGAPEDSPPAERVRDGVERRVSGQVTTRNPTTVAELMEDLRGVRAVLASRLHSAILSLASGTPAVGVSVSQKIGNYLSMIGLSHFFVSVLDDDAAGCATEHVLDPNLVAKVFGALDTSGLREAWDGATRCLDSIAESATI